MSKIGIARFLQLVTKDDEFAKEFSKEPEKALKGFNLTKEEKESLISMSKNLPKIKKNFKEIADRLSIRIY